MVREVCRQGVDLVKAFEGLEDGDPSTVNLDPYMDPAGYWTIGYGHLIVDGGRALHGAADRMRALALYPDGITRAQADALLRADLLDTCRDVTVILREPPCLQLTDAQYAALVSFAYNVGAGALRRSTLLRKLRAGDVEGAAREFPRWNRARGKVLRGLTRRRKAEAAMFLGRTA